MQKNLDEYQKSSARLHSIPDDLLSTSSSLSGHTSANLVTLVTPRAGDGVGKKLLKSFFGGK